MKFRQQAIDYYSRQERHHYPLKILSKKSWLLLSLIGAVMIGAGVWLVLGSVKTQVFGKGLLLAQGGVLYNVSAPFEGSQVSVVHAIPGDPVQPGESLIELKSPSLAQEIEVAQEYINVLKRELDRLNARAEQELAEENIILEKKQSMVNKMIAIEEENIKNLTELSKKYTGMLAKGLATARDTTQILNQLNASKQQLEQSYQSLIEIDLQKRQKKQTWDERLRTLSLQIENEQYKLNQLEQRNQLNAQITSPIEGIVLNLQATVGDVVSEGASLMTLSTQGQGLDMIAFFLPEEGKKIKVGMEALVTPLTIKPEEYGNMMGTVTKVSAFPANNKVMLSILKNENLVRTFAQDTAPLMVTVRLQQDRTTPNGFAWTTSKGPEETITPGTVSDVKVVIKRQPPWTLILPSIKKLFGSS